MKVLIFLIFIVACSAEIPLEGLKSKIKVSAYDLRYTVFDFDVIDYLRTNNLVLIDGTALIRPNVDSKVALFGAGNLKKILSRYFRREGRPINGTLVMYVVTSNSMIRFDIGNINGVPDDLYVSKGDLVLFCQ